MFPCHVNSIKTKGVDEQGGNLSSGNAPNRLSVDSNGKLHLFIGNREFNQRDLVLLMNTMIKDPNLSKPTNYNLKRKISTVLPELSELALKLKDENIVFKANTDLNALMGIEDDKENDDDDDDQLQLKTLKKKDKSKEKEEGNDKLGDTDGKVITEQKKKDKIKDTRDDIRKSLKKEINEALNSKNIGLGPLNQPVRATIKDSSNLNEERKYLVDFVRSYNCCRPVKLTNDNILTKKIIINPCNARLMDGAGLAAKIAKMDGYKKIKKSFKTPLSEGDTQSCTYDGITYVVAYTCESHFSFGALTSVHRRLSVFHPGCVRPVFGGGVWANNWGLSPCEAAVANVFCMALTGGGILSIFGMKHLVVTPKVLDLFHIAFITDLHNATHKILEWPNDVYDYVKKSPPLSESFYADDPAGYLNAFDDNVRNLFEPSPKLTNVIGHVHENFEKPKLESKPKSDPEKIENEKKEPEPVINTTEKIEHTKEELEPVSNNTENINLEKINEDNEVKFLNEKDPIDLEVLNKVIDIINESDGDHEIPKKDNNSDHVFSKESDEKENLNEIKGKGDEDSVDSGDEFASWADMQEFKDEQDTKINSKRNGIVTTRKGPGLQLLDPKTLEPVILTNKTKESVKEPIPVKDSRSLIPNEELRKPVSRNLNSLMMMIKEKISTGFAPTSWSDFEGVIDFSIIEKMVSKPELPPLGSPVPICPSNDETATCSVSLNKLSKVEIIYENTSSGRGVTCKTPYGKVNIPPSVAVLEEESIINSYKSVYQKVAPCLKTLQVPRNYVSSLMSNAWRNGPNLPKVMSNKFWKFLKDIGDGFSANIEGEQYWISEGVGGGYINTDDIGPWKNNPKYPRMIYWCCCDEILSFDEMKKRRVSLIKNTGKSVYFHFFQSRGNSHFQVYENKEGADYSVACDMAVDNGKSVLYKGYPLDMLYPFDYTLSLMAFCFYARGFRLQKMPTTLPALLEYARSANLIGTVPLDCDVVVNFSSFASNTVPGMKLFDKCKVVETKDPEIYFHSPEIDDGSCSDSDFQVYPCEYLLKENGFSAPGLPQLFTTKASIIKSCDFKKGFPKPIPRIYGYGGTERAGNKLKEVFEYVDDKKLGKTVEFGYGHGGMSPVIREFVNSHIAVDIVPAVAAKGVDLRREDIKNTWLTYTNYDTIISDLSSQTGPNSEWLEIYDGILSNMVKNLHPSLFIFKIQGIDLYADMLSKYSSSRKITLVKPYPSRPSNSEIYVIVQEGSSPATASDIVCMNNSLQTAYCSEFKEMRPSDFCKLCSPITPQSQMSGKDFFRLYGVCQSNLRFVMNKKDMSRIGSISYAATSISEEKAEISVMGYNRGLGNGILRGMISKAYVPVIGYGILPSIKNRFVFVKDKKTSVLASGLKETVLSLTNGKFDDFGSGKAGADRKNGEYKRYSGACSKYTSIDLKCDSDFKMSAKDFLSKHVNSRSGNAVALQSIHYIYQSFNYDLRAVLKAFKDAGYDKLFYSTWNNPSNCEDLEVKGSYVTFAGQEDPIVQPLGTMHSPDYDWVNVIYNSQPYAPCAYAVICEVNLKSENLFNNIIIDKGIKSRSKAPNCITVTERPNNNNVVRKPLTIGDVFVEKKKKVDNKDYGKKISKPSPDLGTKFGLISTLDDHQGSNPRPRTGGRPSYNNTQSKGFGRNSGRNWK